jgi:hypothetical protein
MSKIDQFIADAKILRDKVRASIEASQTQLASVETAIAALESLKATAEPEVLEKLLGKSPREDHPDFFKEIEPKQISWALDPSGVVENARKILLEHGRPMKRGQLVREFDSRNLPLAGKDKNKNLGTILWRHQNQFVSLEKLGYWPKDVAIPGVYEPEN